MVWDIEEEIASQEGSMGLGMLRGVLTRVAVGMMVWEQYRKLMRQ